MCWGQSWSTCQLAAACCGERLKGEMALGSWGRHFTSQLPIFSSINPQRAGKISGFSHYIWNTLGNENDIWILCGTREE